MHKKQDENDKMRLLSGWNMPKTKKRVEEQDCKDDIEWPEAVQLCPEGPPPKEESP